MSEIEYKIKVSITPKELARLFAEMDSTQQADVFEEVGRICAEEWPCGQSQWAYVGSELIARGVDSHAWRFAADIGAFTMVHTWRMAERQGVFP